MNWTQDWTLSDGRVCYVNEAGAELLQRPDGEWTLRPAGVTDRLELGTRDLLEAQERVTWTTEQWKAWRAAEAAEDERMFHERIDRDEAEARASVGWPDGEDGEA